MSEVHYCGTCSDFTGALATHRCRYNCESLWRYRCAACLRGGGVGPYDVVEPLDAQPAEPEPKP